MAHNDHVRSIIDSHYQRKDPLGWFEALYASANGVSDQIPWVDDKPNRHLVEWLDRAGVIGSGRRAIVVGCGLGDDAEELSRRGFVVSAFDISATAIDWARRRFPGSAVSYHIADLLNLPRDLDGAFDFVFEAYTIQALPRSLRAQAIASVAGLVRSGAGQLLVVCRGRENDEDEGSLPWPLSHEEIALFEAHGLRQVSFENYFDDERRDEAPIRRFRALFQSDARITQ